MKNLLIILSIILSSFTAKATIHIVNVWDGYFEFTPANITIQLGDTVQWLPLGGGAPSMVHTITSTNIPVGAATFDQIWQAPADTFFQYVPQIVGLYEYECTPHATSHNMIGSINVVDGSTNVNDNFAEEINLIIYPNPTSNILSVDGLYSKTKYKIYSLNGELIMTGKTDKTIDISALIEGSYIIEFLGDIPRVIKILKQ
jgi:plastocyanin